ncbi:MAG: ester cyclase [Gaiellales bacterium]
MDAVEVCTRAQEAMFARGDVNAVDSWTTEGVVTHTAPPGTPAGREGLKATIAWLHSGLDNVTYAVQDAFAAGDKVTMRCTMSATHARPWLGSPATGRSFTVEQIHVFRVDGDRIAEHWACRDDLGMLRQLGLAPTP